MPVVWSYFLLHHGLCALSALQLLLYLVDVILKRLQFSVADFSHLSIVAFPFGAFGFKFQLLHLLLVLLDFA